MMNRPTLMDCASRLPDGYTTPCYRTSPMTSTGNGNFNPDPNGPTGFLTVFSGVDESMPVSVR